MSELDPIIAQRLLSHSLCTLNGLYCLDWGYKILNKRIKKKKKQQHENEKLKEVVVAVAAANS